MNDKQEELIEIVLSFTFIQDSILGTHNVNYKGTPLSDSDKIKYLNDILKKANLKTRMVNVANIYGFSFLIDKWNKPEIYTNIKAKYQETLFSFNISEIGDVSFKPISKIKESKRISCEDLDAIIEFLTVKMTKADVSLFEDLLLNENLDSAICVDLKKRGFEPLIKLLVNNWLSLDDIREIVRILPEEDTYFCSKVFEMISQRGKTDTKVLQSIFSSFKGKKLEITRKNYFPKNPNYQNILETTLKFYIQKEGIITDKILYQYELNPNKIKIQVPLNPMVFDFENVYNLPKKQVSIINECFEKYPYETLKVFRDLLNSEVERVLEKRIDIVISYSFDTGRDEYLLEKIAFDTWRDIKENIHKGFFILGKGKYQRREIIDDSPSWKDELSFYVKDTDGNTRKCIINRNVSYFKEIIKTLKMDEFIEVQGFVHEKIERERVSRGKNKGSYKNIFKGFEHYVIDLRVLKKFEGIKVDVGENHIGKMKLHNTLDGVKVYTHRHKGGNPSENPVLDVPVNLHAIYQGQNEKFYEIEIQDEVLCDTKMNLIDYIDKESSLSYVSYPTLKKYFTIILQEYIKRKNLKPGFMFSCVGVFDVVNEDNQKELVVAYPGKENIKVFGENSLQKILVDLVKEKGIDEDGDLTSAYYDLIHLEAQEEWIRATITGYSGSNPLTYALRDSLDIFPNLFIIGVKGSGKTATTKALISIPFGMKVINQDTIQSLSRFTMYCTSTSSALNIDDLHDMDDDLISFIKSNSTDKGTRDRNTVNQKMNQEQTYASFCGSANEKTWLKGKKNDAFRIRAFIIEILKKIDFKKQQVVRDRKGQVIKKKGNFPRFNIRKRFKELSNEIKNGKLFGYYLMEKALEFAEKCIEDDKLTNYHKLAGIIKQNEDNLTDLFTDKNIELVDSRRLTMYALLYTGWQIWTYVFSLKGYESPLLQKYMDLKQDYFLELVKNLEGTELSILLEDIENILNYFEYYYEEYEKPLHYHKGLPVVNSAFINSFDKFARERGYGTFGVLRVLTEAQNDILGTSDKPGSYRCKYEDKKEIDEVSRKGFIITKKKTIWGTYFRYSDLCKLFNREPKEVLNLSQEIPNPNERIQSQKAEKIRKLLERIKAIFEETEIESASKEELIQGLDVQFDDMDKEFIIGSIDGLVQDGTLFELRGNIGINNK